MKLFVPGNFRGDARFIMRRSGYGENPSVKNGRLEMSYVRRLSPNQYPRFHVYIEKQPDGLQINLHLDQKKASYEGFTAHNGEYDGELVEGEMARLKSSVLIMKIA